MCYNKEISKNLFIINIISCYILYNYENKDNTNKILALFYGFGGLMQLFDWIFWDNQDKNNINYYFTKVAMIANNMQPIVLALLIYYYNNGISDNSKTIITIYSIIILLFTLNIYNKLDYTLIKQTQTYNGDNRNSLFWQWNTIDGSVFAYTVYILCLSILAYDNFDYPKNILLVFINTASFLFSFFYFKSNMVGRFWCKLSALIPSIFLLVNIFIK